jgi:hypothetical protein
LLARVLAAIALVFVALTVGAFLLLGAPSEPEPIVPDIVEPKRRAPPAERPVRRTPPPKVAQRSADRAPPPPRPTTLPKEVLSTISAYRRVEIRPEVAPDADRKDEDAAFKELLRHKVDTLAELEALLEPLTESEDPRTATEAQLTLSTLYEDMGHTIAESPAPSYLTKDQASSYADALDAKAGVQFDKALKAAERAIETADAFEDGHPIHAAIDGRINFLASL